VTKAKLLIADLSLALLFKCPYNMDYNAFWYVDAPKDNLLHKFSSMQTEK